MVDLRREREMIRRKGFAYAQQTIGEAVLWIEYDAKNSETHDVYDEATIDAGRAWKPPILVPVQWVNEAEATRANDTAGRLPTNSLRFAVDMRTLRRCGLSAPEDSNRHLNDLIVWRRNFWRIGRYEKMGRLRETTMVGVTASQIHAGDDMPWGDLPQIDGLLSTARPTGPQNDSYPTQTFDEYELPAYHDVP